MRKPIKLTFTKAAILTGLGFLVGTNADRLLMPSDQYKANHQLTTVFNNAVNEHISHPAPEKLAQIGINAMLESLDPHSIYIPADITAGHSGPYRGMGITLTKNDQGQIQITDVYSHTPAERAGMKAGDVITGVDGKTVTDLDLKEVIKLLQKDGEEKTTLKIRRYGHEDELTFSVQSDVIDISPVSGKILGDDIGYVRLRSFDEKSADDVEAMFEALTARLNSSASGYILDLRGNPGGGVSQAVRIADLFLNEGRITSIANNEKIQYSYVASEGDILEGKPLVVLVDGGSASASEMLSGALQDNHRATIMGTPTYGKGTMQSVYEIPEWRLLIFEGAPEGELRITTNYYLTPSDASIQGRGITPDILFETPADDTPGFRHESDWPNVLPNPEFAPGTAVTDEICRPRPDMTPDELSRNAVTPSGKQDFLLLGAIDKLKNSEKYTERLPTPVYQTPARQGQAPAPR